MTPGPHAGNRNRPAYSGQPRFRFPKQIVQLFAPRKPLEFKPPPRKRRLRPMTGLADFVNKFRTSSEQPSASIGNTPKNSSAERDHKDDMPKSGKQFETPAQRRQRKKRERQQNVANIVAKARAEWQASKTKSTSKKGIDWTTEPYSTLFIWNLPRTAAALCLQNKFEAFGPVRTVVIPEDLEGAPRGYAFIEFEHERDADIAVRQADGMRFEGRRLKVDVERGRTVKGWFPTRLDGPHNSCAAKHK